MKFDLSQWESGSFFQAKLKNEDVWRAAVYVGVPSDGVNRPERRLIMVDTGEMWISANETMLDAIRVNPTRHGGDLKFSELVVACANVGVDLNCGTCASVFYTGGSEGHPHTCQKAKGPFICGECGSDDLHALAWVDTKTEEFLEYQESEPMSHWMCQGECEDHPPSIEANTDKSS